MAERLKIQLIESDKMVDIVAGPDSYRSLPHLLAHARSGQQAINVMLSQDETYADISPVRVNSNGVSAYVYVWNKTLKLTRKIYHEGLQQHVHLLYSALYSRQRKVSPIPVHLTRNTPTF